jgi:glycerophosphoryl diester phosphodiesterase
MSAILAHRGASGYLPEMTLAAYRLGLEMGVAGLEVDVRLTKDDVLVAIHDRKTKRVANKNLTISNSTYQDLKNLNFYGEEKTDGVFQIVKLSELLDLVISFNKPLVLAIETKHPSIKSFKLEKRVCDLLKSYGLKKGKISNVQIILMSFNLFAVRSFAKLMPDTQRVMLVEKNYPFLAAIPTPGNAQFVGPGIELLNKNPKLLKRWRKRGKQLFVWTVDSPKDVKWCLEEKIEFFVSNFPDRALAIQRKLT